MFIEEVLNYHQNVENEIVIQDGVSAQTPISTSGDQYFINSNKDIPDKDKYLIVSKYYILLLNMKKQFGTLVRLQTPYQICNDKIAIQVGRTVLTIVMKSSQNQQNTGAGAIGSQTQVLLYPAHNNSQPFINAQQNGQNKSQNLKEFENHQQKILIHQKSYQNTMLNKQFLNYNKILLRISLLYNLYLQLNNIDFADDERIDKVFEKGIQRFDKLDFKAAEQQSYQQQMAQINPTGQIQLRIINTQVKEKSVVQLSSTVQQTKPGENTAPIISNYVRPQMQSDMVFMKCEMCGKNFPKNQINEHVQLELQDPRYNEIKKELDERITCRAQQQIILN